MRVISGKHKMQIQRMRRPVRAFLFGIIAITFSFAVEAQPSTVPIVGYLSGSSQDADAEGVAAFRRGLEQSGYVEGHNVAIEYRWADGRYDRLPALAVELVRRGSKLIVTTGGTVATLAAKAATSETPIVFAIGSDPITSGVVTSLNRPEGNLTGVSLFSHDLSEKRLELIRELIPGLNNTGLLVNRTNAMADTAIRHVVMRAGMSGSQLHVVSASTDAELDAAFGSFAGSQIAGIVVFSDPFFAARRGRIVELAARYKLPAIYDTREYAAAGGLISYGIHPTDGHRHAAVYAAKILRGAKPADLPVEQPTKFELVINLKSTKALGLAVPAVLLARADEVIE